MSEYNRHEPFAGRLSLARLTGGHVTGAIIGGGFLLGILFGAILLSGSPDAPADQQQGSTSSAPKDSAASPTSVDAVPASESDDGPVGLASERDRLQRELEAEKLRIEVETLRRQLVDLKSSPVSVEAPDERPSRNRNPGSAGTATRSVSAPSSAEVRAVEPGQATLEYWDRMNAIILQEASLRSVPAGGITAGNAAGFLDARIAAAQFAVDGIRQLDANGVDARVVELGQQLARWYEDGGKVAATGSELLRGASVQDRQGSAGKRYQAAERSHSQSVGAINAAGEQVRGEMSRKYGLSFPPLN
ncbi:MAG: hypothetical protein AB7U20_13350 [Planctomycetaceae bacterium]